MIAMLLFFIEGILSQSYACSCYYGYFANLEEEIAVAYNGATLIFEGTVDNITKIVQQTKNGYSYEIHEFTFSVQTMWKGQNATTLVTRFESHDTCGFAFQMGISYLIYGWQDDNPSHFSTHNCARIQVVFNTIEQGKAHYNKWLLEDIEKRQGKNAVEEFLRRTRTRLNQEVELLNRFKTSPEDIQPIIDKGFAKEGADYVITGVEIRPLDQQVIDGKTHFLYSKTLTSQLDFEIHPVIRSVDVQELPAIKQQYATPDNPVPTLSQINETIPEHSVLRFDKPIQYKDITIPANQNILEVEAVKNSFDGSFMAVGFPDVLTPEVIHSVYLKHEDFNIPHGMYHIYFQWGTAFGQIFSDTIEVNIQLEE